MLSRAEFVAEPTNYSIEIDIRFVQRRVDEQKTRAHTYLACVQYELDEGFHFRFIESILLIWKIKFKSVWEFEYDVAYLSPANIRNAE